MPKLTRWGFSYLLTATLAGVAGAGLGGCGDNKPKGRPMTDGGDAGDGMGTTCSGSFISPTAGAMLTVADAIGGTCTGGFKINVRVATSQPDGTSVDLLVGTAKVATATVSGAEVHFDNVQLPEGSNTLKASFSTTCSLMATVNVNCNLPTCTITKPVISATHIALNGVLVANGGDRASAAGSPYQVEFDVMTNVEDGQPVTLNITNPTAGTGISVVSGTAVGGLVKFAGVTLVPDGNYTIEALCTNKAGAVGRSTKGMYPVDSTPPALTISSPPDGKFFAPGDLTNGAFQVCARTADKDATSDTAKNLSVAVGTGSPDPNSGYAAITATDTDTCVSVACTSSTPVNLTVTLKDAAGNSTVKTLSNISCATSLPGVQIVSPVGDTSPFNDISKHLLASTSGNTLRDQDATKLGAQWTVVACADKAGKGTLYAGAMGTTLAAAAGPIDSVPAGAGDNCPAGYSNVVRFVAATLPDSQENADETLALPTELRVDVTTPTSATGMSSVVDLWVDSSAPNIQPYLPNPLCGLIHQSATDWTTIVQLVSTTAAVTLVVNSPNGSISYPTATRMSLFNTFPSVAFALGVNQVTATGSDVAGNVGVLTSPCTVTVGTPPIVTFTTPIATNTLCASVSSTGTCIADGSAATAGWQGNLAVNVTVAGVPATSGMVTFAAGGTSLGTANIDSSGHAQLTNVTITDGRGVAISATTTDIGGHGIGITSETLVVDTVLPDTITTITPTVKNRRQTSFHLAWNASADSGQSLASYLVRVSKAPITAANFDAATDVPYTGSPSAPGVLDGIDVTGRVIENNYYFAVAGVDTAGNRSTVVSAGPTAAHFNLKVLSPPGVGSTERFGASVDGVADVNGDGKSDLLVGSAAGQNAYIYFGSANFASVSGPSVVIGGPSSATFGRNFIDIGDIDADGKDDFALSATTAGDGRVYIMRGRSAWNATYSADADADYVIQADSSYAGTFFASMLSRLGDFNGDGVDDFAISSFGYNTGRGRVLIVLGKTGFSGVAPDVQTIDGDSAFPSGNFGNTILGTGRFYTVTAGTSLVVAAPAAGSNVRGRVYAFHGRAGMSGAIVATAADQFVDGPLDNIAYGQGLALLGSISGVPGVAVNAGRNSALGAGIVDVYYGSTSAGPFALAPLRFTDSLATTSATDSFGRVILGSAFTGTSITVSIIGDSRPDLVAAPITESGGGPARVYILDGARLGGISSPADVVTTADVILPLPTDWKTVSLQRNGMIRDLDGDGYSDFAIGENITGGTGRLAVYW